MIGGNHLGVLVTHVDKASKFLVAGLAKNKTASEINRVTEKLFQEIHPDQRKTWFFVTWYGSIGGHKSTKSLSGKRLN